MQSKLDLIKSNQPYILDQLGSLYRVLVFWEADGMRRGIFVGGFRNER